MVVVAVEEGHDPRPVGQREAERLLEEALRCFDGVAVEDDVSEPDRPVAGLAGVGMRGVAVHDLEEAPVGVANEKAGSAGGIVERLRPVQHAAARLHRGRGDAREGFAAPRAQGDVANRGRRAGMQREQMMVGAAAAQVEGIGAAAGDGEVPHARVERFGGGEIGNVQRHAAQPRDPRRIHGVLLAARPRKVSALRWTSWAVTTASKPAASMRSTGAVSPKLKG